MTIVDLFAGPGGWSEGLAMLGLTDIGIEWDRDACLTRRAAGHLTVQADVATYPPEAFTGVTGLIASPPCPDFSAAGSGLGRAGKSGWLVDVPRRWVETLRPEWVACEQVPGALPIWREHAHAYRELGYSTWCGILNSAGFGVPQTRKRAILLASQVGQVGPPAPTHAQDPKADLFGPGLKPWVTMADALGWHGTVDRRQQSDGTPVRLVPTDEPAPTLTGIAGAKSQWVMDRQGWCWENPAPTLSGGGTGGGGGVEPFANAEVRRKIAESWPYRAPATTVAGDPRITARCHHDDGSQGANAKTTDDVRRGDYAGTEPVRLTIDEATVLQSFRPGYPWQGSRTSQFTQVGNAVPPLLAGHVLSAVTGVPLRALAVAS